MTDAPARPAAAPSLFLPSTMVGLGAFLLFQVQPLLAKRILPWFGGSAAVWTACMLFFQVMLLLGYGYAHALQQLPARRQALVHGGLLVASLLLMPLSPSPSWKPTVAGDPTLRILGLLFATVGLPYLLLSATSPLVQAWVSRERPGWQPWRLFALSNAGSLFALLSYPVLIEPFLVLPTQAWAWTITFAAYVACALTMAWRARVLPDGAPHEEVADGPAPGVGLRVFWVALAFVPSLLLLSVTSHLSTNVAPIPFLWVLPLCLYLLSFILTFEHPRWYFRTAWLGLLGPALIAMGLMLSRDFAHAPVRVQVPLFSAGLLIVCMAGHGELARLRPHPRHLTGFYLCLSIGGALGGVFAGLIAPRIFHSLFELPLGLVLCGLLAFLAWARDSRQENVWVRRALLLMLALAAGGVLSMATYYRRESAKESLVQARNFYGALRVKEEGSGEDRMRLLLHGTINHGGQYLAPGHERDPATYYGRSSGVGRALTDLQNAGPVKAGVIGLGSGGLLSYVRPGDRFRVYEINPLVETLARTWFEGLPKAPAPVDLVLGDARLMLETEAPQAYDLLAVDAFSSDSIPVHLLTREAFDAYRRHLKPAGILAVHISNRYLDLKPVLVAEVAAGGWKAVFVNDDAEDEPEGVYSSDWVLLSRDPAALQSDRIKAGSEPLKGTRTVRRWSDDFSNLYRILK
ncbi:MAG TPA: fused MFS/spermidine synthase [Holophagaceae bacterium]|nr:fused MFS/spermidine synthase [Holophagaceae bacterium]